ncbi:uncharacterized protein LOC132552158 [Ylistrum balloti]|uniref:uncharacterized protein LOC132552158 n=1 Tax=Ylistrum balloti TaxID=509963 RepID=UPI002905F3BF|nr:uncharacterized protein LOC132552158 [Ylistrum balloti]
MHPCKDQSDLPDHHNDVIPKPNLEFEDGTHSIFMIIQKFPFPVVVLCDTTRCPIPVDRSRFNFDLSQPLLFYRKRSIQKIPARSVYVDDTDQYQEAGDPLLIPEDYKGYFAILKRRNLSGTTDNNAPHFTKIEDIAQSDTEKFLIGGQNRVKAYQVINGKDDDQSYYDQQRMLFPGDVLRKLRLITSETKKKTKFLRRRSLITEKFLLCLDEADREVIIPFTQTGLFYALTTASGKGTCPVMQMSEIVANKFLPCVVKLVYGRVPTTPCFFPGLLQLDQGYLEQSIVAATIMNKKNILVEIPSTCKMEFRVAHTNDELISHQGYKNAVDVSREKIHSYMRNIKVCLSCKSDDQLHSCESSGSITVGERVSQVSLEPEMEPPKPCTKDINRDSGYIKMAPSSDDLCMQSDGKPEISQDQYVKMKLTSHTSPPPDYVLKLFLENKLFEVPVYSSDANQTVDTDDTENTYTLKGAENRSQHVTTPPDLPPPPVPCPGTPPSLCGGSPSQDSGISDIGLTDTRRPSTFIFAESEQNPDDNTYDIPQIPTRRVSAPPNFDTVPIIPDSKQGASPKLFQFTRSRSANKRVSSTPSEMLKEDGRLTSPTDTIHEHDFATENPCYENIEGMKEIQAKLIEHQNLTESIDPDDDLTSFRLPWYLESLDSSERYQTPPSSSSPQRHDDDIHDPLYYMSPNDIDHSVYRTPTSKSPGLSSSSVSLSDPFDNVFDISPCNPTPHDYLELIDAVAGEKKEEEDDEDVYDVIPDIPGTKPLSAPQGTLKMSDNEYVDCLNSDLVENEQPPLPHHMQPVTYTNSCVKANEACEESSDTIGTHLDDDEGDSTKIQESDHAKERENGNVENEGHHQISEISDSSLICHIESEVECLYGEETKDVNKDSDFEIDEVDQAENNSSLRGLNPNSVEWCQPESQEDNILVRDTMLQMFAKDTSGENELDEEADCQEKGCVDEDDCDDCKSENQGNCDKDIHCGAIESQQNELNKKRSDPICDNLSPTSSSESLGNACLQIKPTPPPISPKPIRNRVEKPETVSQEIPGTISSNSEESSHVDEIDNQPVHHQLKHRERTESNSISMSLELLENELNDIGVTLKARNIIKDRNIGIEDLLSMDVDSLQKDLPGVGFLDLKRIAMFIRNIMTRATGH